LGQIGKQRITDTGPLTKKRMETCDDEFVGAAKDFIKRQSDAGIPANSDLLSRNAPMTSTNAVLLSRYQRQRQ
jgi:hypothetical protein